LLEKKKATGVNLIIILLLYQLIYAEVGINSTGEVGLSFVGETDL